jgi:hypothetical protein
LDYLDPEQFRNEDVKKLTRQEENASHNAEEEDSNDDCTTTFDSQGQVTDE